MASPNYTSLSPEQNGCCVNWSERINEAVCAACSGSLSVIINGTTDFGMKCGGPDRQPYDLSTRILSLHNFQPHPHTHTHTYIPTFKLNTPIQPQSRPLIRFLSELQCKEDFQQYRADFHPRVRIDCNPIFLYYNTIITNKPAQTGRFDIQFKITIQLLRLAFYVRLHLGLT